MYKDRDKVISLGAVRARRADPALREVEAYWETLRNGRLAPARSEVDPRAIAASLDKTFLMERLAPGLARFRVAGRGISHVMGMELAGMPISTCFLPDARPRLGQLLERVMTDPAVVHASIVSPAGFGRSEVTGQMLVMPLCDETGGMNRMLGCLVTTGAVGRRPRRFEITSVTPRRILRSRPEAATWVPKRDDGFVGAEPGKAENIVKFPELAD